MSELTVTVLILRGVPPGPGAAGARAEVSDGMPGCDATPGGGGKDGPAFCPTEGSGAGGSATGCSSRATKRSSGPLLATRSSCLPEEPSAFWLGMILFGPGSREINAGGPPATKAPSANDPDG